MSSREIKEYMRIISEAIDNDSGYFSENSIEEFIEGFENKMDEEYFEADCEEALESFIRSPENQSVLRRFIEDAEVSFEQAGEVFASMILGHTSFQEFLEFDGVEELDTIALGILKKHFPIVYESRNLNEAEESISEDLIKQYQERANAEREAGAEIEINFGLPYVAISMSDGSEYFFQESKAQELLDGIPSNIDAEDYLLAQAQNW